MAIIIQEMIIQTKIVDGKDERSSTDHNSTEYLKYKILTIEKDLKGIKSILNNTLTKR